MAKAVAHARHEGAGGVSVAAVPRRLLILLVAAAVVVAAGGCHLPFIMMTVAAEAEGSGYFWKRMAPGTCHAAEGGRRVRFAAITLRARGDIAGGWEQRLVEECGAAGPHGRACAGAGGADSTLPCWPRDRRRPSTDLLAAINRNLPPHRDLRELMWVAETINREVGPFRPAYLVGTRPLAIAFLEEQPDVRAYERLAGQQPWPPEEAKGVTILRRADGTIADASDGRRRHPRLVSESDLAAGANVVLLYPPGLDLETARQATPYHPSEEWKARLLILPAPRPLSELIDGVAEPQGLIGTARLVVEVPVR